MDNVLRQLKGDFKAYELRRYLVFEAVFFWGLIFQCWRTFPEENAFSIMTHTFSFLGSFDSHRNPDGWWLFSIALVFWGMATVPVVLYIRRCFQSLAGRGGRTGGALLLVGALGIVLVGLFPDSHATAIGNWPWGALHKIAALVLVVGFLFGIPLLGVTLLRARLAVGENHAISARVLWPYLFFSVISGVALAFLARWEFLYAGMKAAAVRSGTGIGSSWAEALGTRYSFPLWDNVFIYTLFITLVWIALTAPPVRN